MPHHSLPPVPQERRRHLRVESNVPLKIASEEGDILTETKNISCSGAFCRIGRRLEPMTKLQVHLLLPLQKSDKLMTKKISCQGVVVRVQAAEGQDCYDTAIFFNDIAPKDTLAISDFIDSMLEKKNYGKYN